MKIFRVLEHKLDLVFVELKVVKKRWKNILVLRGMRIKKMVRRTKKMVGEDGNDADANNIDKNGEVKIMEMVGIKGIMERLGGSTQWR